MWCGLENGSSLSFWLHIGHWLLIVARAACHFSCPFLLPCAEFSLPTASSMAPRARICEFMMFSVASAVSVFALSDLFSDLVPYSASVAKDLEVEIRSPLQSSNSCTTASSLLPSLTVHT